MGASFVAIILATGLLLTDPAVTTGKHRIRTLLYRADASGEALTSGKPQHPRAEQMSSKGEKEKKNWLHPGLSGRRVPSQDTRHQHSCS